MSDSSSHSLSISSLLLFAGIAFVVIRYFLGGGSGTNGRGSSARAGGGQRVNIAAVEQVAAMFPQLDRRAIAWDLQRNGGNPQASVERMLTRGALETPPPSFQPQGLQPAQAASAPGISNAKKPAKPLPQDLITRYRLADKLAAQREETEGQTAGSQEQGAATATGTAKSSGWSQNKGERASMLQQRREAMILAARRKMEEKDRRDAKGKGKEVVETAAAE